MDISDSVCKIVLSTKVTNAVLINSDSVIYDASFRKMCEQNSCGRYGKYYVCPPYVGDVYLLIDRARAYPQAVL